MSPHNVTRTSTFRLTACFGAVCGLAIILLLGLIYQQTTSVLARRVDHILRAEATALARSSPEVILSVIKDQSARDPLAEFAVYSMSGEKVAGRGALTPGDLTIDGAPRDFQRSGSPPRRAIAVRLPWGETLVVARDTSQLVEFRRIILGALLWSGGLIVVLVGASAIALSLPPLRRISETQVASEAIAAGDFSVRLPIHGSQDELDELARIVNAMMDEIERLITEARTVGEGIAHELRTPLTRLRTTLDHAADCLGPDDPSKALLETCIAETDGLLSRFRALLRIAAVEARGRRTAFTELSLTEVVTQVIELYEPVAANRRVAIRGQLQDNVNIPGDGELLFEAISNVLDNAIKFSPQGSTILVEIRGERSGAVILVTDKGPGIDVRDRPFVTKRFYRAMGAMSVPGHGLGLSLVAAVAEIHGFELSFEDAAPGTIVRFALSSPRASRPRAPGFALH